MKIILALLLLASQMWGSGYYCRSVTIDHTQVSTGTQTDFPWLYTNAAGALGANLNATDGSSTVSVATLSGVSATPAISNGDYIKIQSEIMLVTAGGGTSSLTATRAQLSTTEATHAESVPIIDLTAIGYLATVANGGKVANASGYDIYFSSSSTGATVLPFELDYYEPTTGYGAWWIKETLSNTTDHVTYLCYGNSAVTTSQASPTAVWSNGFVGVWHLNNYADSLGVLNGTAVSGGGTLTSHGIGEDRLFAATGYVDVSAASALNVTPLTIDAWVNPVDGGNYMVFAKDGGASAGGYSLFLASTLNLVFSDGSLQAIYRCSSCSTVNSFGSHVAVTLTGNTGLLYLNGASVAFSNVGSAATGVGSNALHAMIGARPDGSLPMGGNIDELRLSNVVRSAGWIATEFNNQNNANTFYSVGTETPISALISQTITFPTIPNHTDLDAPFALTATASSGLTVAYSVTSGPATVSGSTVTLTGAIGSVTIQATQAGNGTYSAATPVSKSFTVGVGQRGNISFDQIKASDRTGNGNQLLTWNTPVPATSGATGAAGQQAYDSAGNFYWCYATNLWARIGPGGFSTSW